MSRLPAFVLVPLILAAAGAAYVLNLGWFRVIGLLPAAAEAVLWAALAIGAWAPRRRALWFATAAAFLAFHLMLPDFGDVDPAYAFFGLWKSTAATDWLLPAAGVAGVLHLVLLVWLGMAWSNEARSAKDKSGTKS